MRLFTETTTGLCLCLLTISLSSQCQTTRADLGGAGPHTFDYLLGEDSNFDSSARILFVDYDLPKNVITGLLSQGKRVICYVNVGAWEDFRNDASQFPPSTLGKDYEGWPGEKWLDIRQLDSLLPIMRSRFRTAADKGCEGIDPDNMVGYNEDTGFPLSYNDQLVYNKAIAGEIHGLGMLTGLKNDPEQAIELEPFMDFSVVEECASLNECQNFQSSFISHNKPVFGIEYKDYYPIEAQFNTNVCNGLNSSRISFILKEWELHNNYTVACIH